MHRTLRKFRTRWKDKSQSDRAPKDARDAELPIPYKQTVCDLKPISYISCDDGTKATNTQLVTQTKSTRPRFHHTPLENPARQVRLLKYLQDTNTGSLEFELQTWWLSNVPPFAAVSYIWGSSAKSQTISINGCTFDIGWNCFYALSQIAHHRGELRAHFWIDSICIDQDNSHEKGSQVQLMGKLYSWAEVVLACVGCHADDSKFVIDVLAETKASQLPQMNLNRKSRMRDRILLALDRHRQEENGETQTYSDLFERLGKAFTLFCNRPYWTRVWIVREVRLARHILLLCDTAMLNLADIAFMYSFKDDEDGFFGDNWDPEWNETSMRSIIDKSSYDVKSYRDTYGPENYMIQLDDALQRSARWICSNFRDHLYGLLHIIKWPEGADAEQIHPDYEITKPDLILQLARCLRNPSYCATVTDHLATLVHLLRAVRLTTHDKAMQRLIEFRDPSKWPRSQQNVAALQRKRSREFWIHHSYSGQAFRLTKLEDCSFTVDIEPPSYRREQYPKIDEWSKWGFELKIKDQIRGYLCVRTLPGDCLLKVGHQGETWLVIRRRTDDESVFEFIGYALIRDRLLGSYAPTQQLDVVTHVDLFFDLEDLLMFVAFYDLVQGISPLEDNHCDASLILRAGLTRARFSSYDMRKDCRSDQSESSVEDWPL